MHKKEIEWQSIGFIGEAMLELSKINDSYQMSVAGDTYNTAVYLQRLTEHHPITIHYITGLGMDSQSEKIKSSLVGEGIDTRAISEVSGKQPGLYMIDTREDGERSFSYWRSDSTAKYWLESPDSERVLAMLQTMDAIYLSGISIAILSDSSRDKLLTTLQAVHQGGATIIFDNNYRPALWESEAVAREWYDRVFQLTDIALLTVDDDHALYGEISDQAIIERCQQQGVQEIILKRGANDCLVGRPEQETIAIPSVTVRNVVDTTAAGDSFGAGYLAARITGNDPQIAAAAGHTLASVVIQHRGAIIPKHEMPAL